MTVSYKKLWKILIDRDMNKEDLRKSAKVTTASMAKLGKDECVHLEVLLKICQALDCDITDILEIKR